MNAPYLAPYPRQMTPEQMSLRYEGRRATLCPCGHTYAAHHILGGECTAKVEGKVWRPCPCNLFTGPLDD